MKHVKAYKLSLEDIDFGSDLDIVKSLCVLHPNPESVVLCSDGTDELLVEAAKQCAFFSWDFTVDDIVVRPFCSFTVNGRDVPIDSDQVHYMRGQARGLAEKMGCRFFVDLTPHDMGKAYNAARLSNRADREARSYYN